MKTRKGLILAVLSVFSVACSAVAVTTIEKAPVVITKAEENSFEQAFTQNGKYVITNDFGYNNTLEYIDGTSVGGEGAVLKTNVVGGIAGFAIDLSALHISAKNVENVKINVKVPNASVSDEFRTSVQSGVWVQYGVSSDLSTWQTITLTAKSIADMTNDNGELGKIFIAVRIKGNATEAYFGNVEIKTEAEQNYKEAVLDQVGPWDWNNNTHHDVIPSGGVYTILVFNETPTADTKNYAETDNEVSRNFKLNGVSFYELYKADPTHYRINSQLGFLAFGIPASALVAVEGEQYPVITVEKGTKFQDLILPEMKLSCENGVWKNLNCSMTGFRDGWNHKIEGTKDSTVLTFDTEYFAPGQQVYASELSGITYNGEELARTDVILWEKKNFWISIPTKKEITGYNGYSHPTITFQEGAMVKNSNNQTFTFRALELYLVDGVWTTQKPEGYCIAKEATFLGVDDTSTATKIVLKYEDESIWNTDTTGVENLLWFDNTVTLLEDGGSVAIDTVNKTVTVNLGAEHEKFTLSGGPLGGTILPAVTLYASDSSWETKPQKTTELKGVGVYGNNNVLINVPGGKVYHTVIQYADTLELNGGKEDNLNQASDTSYEIATKMKFDGKTFAEWYNENHLMYVGYFAGHNYLTVQIPKEIMESEPINGYKTHTIEMENGTVFMDKVLPSLTVYNDGGLWSAFNPNYEYADHVTAEFDFIPAEWNNRDTGDGYKWTILRFNKSIGSSSDSRNQASNQKFDIANKLKINGKSIYEYYTLDHNTLVDFSQGNGYVLIKIHGDFLEPKNGQTYTVMELEDKTNFAEEVLGGVKFVLFGGEWVSGENFNPNPLAYNGIAGDWNAVINNGAIDTILCFGENGKDFLGGDNGTTSHSDATNLAYSSSQIATKLTLNGKPIKEYKGVTVSYAHGYNYLYISLPEYALYPNGEYKCSTLHIEKNTIFKNSVLSEVTLYYFEGQWRETKPETVDAEDQEYVTADNLFGNVEGKYVLEGESSLLSTFSVNGNTVYSYLFKSDVEDFIYELTSHYGETFAGLRLTVVGEKRNGKSVQNFYFYDGGDDVKATGSAVFEKDELYAVRIAYSFENGKISVVVSVDGIVYLNYSGDFNATLGNSVGIQNGEGKNEFLNYKTGDIKKPILNFQGKKSYRFEVGSEKPGNEIFTRSLSISDNVDQDTITPSSAEIIWQDGAVKNGILQQGVWTVTVSVSDLAGNTAKYYVTAVVCDSKQVTVSFVGYNETNAIKGELIEAPEVPVKEADETGSYVFDGWYLGDKKWDFENDFVFENTELTAKFKIVYKEYTVKITSEGLEKGYSYELKLHYGATVENGLFGMEGYTYALSVGGQNVRSVVVNGDTDVKVVYTKEQTEDPTHGETGKKKGCKGSVGASFGVFAVMGAVAVATTKKTRKEEEDDDE